MNIVIYIFYYIVIYVYTIVEHICAYICILHDLYEICNDIHLKLFGCLFR